jgi:hypothetical protein
VERLRQIHSDDSVSEITLKQDSWRVRLTIPRPDGTELNLFGIQSDSLDEAQELASKAMARENRSHSAMVHVRAGQSFKNEQMQTREP